MPSSRIINILPELSRPNAISSFCDIEVDTMVLNTSEYKNKLATFENVVFKGDTIFDKVNFANGIIFKDCTFDGVLGFLNCVVNQYDQLLVPDSESITFRNCTFNELVEFKGNETEIQQSLVFTTCNFLYGITISDIKIAMEGITFQSCQVNKGLEIINASINKDLHFIGNSIDTYVRLGSISSSHIAFTKSNVVTGNLHVDRCRLLEGIIFNDGIYKDDIYFSLNDTHGTGLAIIDASFDKTFYLNYHSGKIKPERGISRFHIASSKFANGLFIMGTQDIFAASPRVDEINLNTSPMLTGNISFNDLDIGILQIGGYNVSSKITFKHIQVNQIKIKGFINEGAVIFSDFRASSSEWVYSSNPQMPRGNAIYIDDSNFGKTQFFQTNFRSFETIVLHNTILNEISTSLVTWFTRLQLEKDDIKNAKIALKQAKKSKNKQKESNGRSFLVRLLETKKELYKQLKFVAQKQGDIPLVLEFQSYEMDYHRQITKYRKPRKWNEYFILMTSLSNNFGQSWFKAFLLLMLFSFLSYIPIGFLTSKELDYSQFATSFQDVLFNIKVVIVLNLKSWIVLLNPAHRTIDIDKNIDQFSAWIILWDLLSRVVVAYFVFQMVSAFRKFSK